MAFRNLGEVLDGGECGGVFGDFNAAQRREVERELEAFDGDLDGALVGSDGRCGEGASTVNELGADGEILSVDVLYHFVCSLFRDFLW